MRCGAQGSGSVLTDCRLQKFTLPASEADEVLYRLAKLDITPSAIDPGYQSIVADRDMQTRWTEKL